MSSGPEGGLSKRKHNRLNLKSAVAAFMVATASPAVGQVPEQNTVTLASAEKGLEDLDSVRKIYEKDLDAGRAYVQRLEKRSPGEAWVEREKKDFLQRETALRSKGFLRGLSIIREYGGDISRFDMQAPIQTIEDHAALRRLLGRIPAELRKENILMPADLKENPGYRYDRPGLTEMPAKYQSIRGSLDIKDFNALLDAEEETPNFKQLFDAAVSRGPEISIGTDLLYELKKKRIGSASLANPAFVEGIARAAKAGISLSTITPYESAPSDRRDFESKMSDPAFVDAITALHAQGVVALHGIIGLPSSAYRSPDFVQNALHLRSLQRIGGFDLVRFAPMLVRSDFKQTLDGVPQKRLSETMLFLRDYASDSASWSAASNLVQRYRDDERMLSALPALTRGRLGDLEYLREFETAVRASRDVGYVSGYAAAREADDVLLWDRLGKKVGDLVELSLGQFGALMSQNSTGAIGEILRERASTVYYTRLWNMNELHDASPSKRLQELEGADAGMLFDMMTRVGADAYLSSFRLMYNGNGYTGREREYSFMAKVQQSGSLSDFLQRANPSQRAFGTFLEVLSQNDLLDTFLADLGDADTQQRTLTKFLFEGSGTLSQGQAITIDELVHATKNQPIQQFVINSLQGFLKRSDPTAGVLVAEIFRSRSDVPEWAKESVASYKEFFQPMSKLDSAASFRMEGGRELNVQLHAFYDDRGDGKPEAAWDGHQSFRNFIRTLGGDVQWSSDGAIKKVSVRKGIGLEDRGEYIVIEKKSANGKRAIRIFANKPDRNDKTVLEVNERLKQSEKPQVIVHRGHSYHANKTIGLLDESVALVNLGSCGGVKNISEVLKKSPRAQVMATRGVGTMRVNDTLLAEVDSTLLRDGAIDWQGVQTRLDSSFAKGAEDLKERWRSYQLPHRNSTADLIAAYNRSQ
ncbi:MAG: hypothetical protein HYS26_00145 [Candidatus Kaiserbacteria bacterium]|nr:MAG: hypothetical protein HYS26_00145 [Candidatus Kaiserbacteria bacterium]